MKNKKIAVIGAGPMGLVCAYELAKKGYSVEVFEKENETGGMSAHFDFSGLNIEKYYHFVCGPDKYTFDLLKELNLYSSLKWTDTKMGFYYDGALYKWDGPFELLFFPKASLLEKIRYGLHIFFASKYKNWHKIDGICALDWLKKWEGKSAYLKFWDSLFQLKFYELKERIAAPWLWSRLARVAKSRKSIFQERMGYISGGCLTLLSKLQSEIEKTGGKIHLASPVQSVNFNGGKVDSITVESRDYAFDAVVSTIPLQYLNGMVRLPHDEAEALKKIDNVGVVCVIAKLDKKLTGNFWLNINDERFDIPGIIEISNLNRELDAHIVYAPFYLRCENPKYNEDDGVFKAKTIKYFELINPGITGTSIKDIRVFRYQYAQPVTTPHFLSSLPPISNETRRGFYFADTAYSYPEDRSINESVKIAYLLAEAAAHGI